MAKKKFTDGLESLFGTSSENYKIGSDVDVKKDSKEGKKISKKRNKNFTASLDSLFERDMEASKVSDYESSGEDHSSRRNRNEAKPVFGIDSLIRATTDEVIVNTPINKRVSFVFERKKFERLKEIAKKEKKYIKDILGGLIIDFIKDYEESK